jgi:methyltransferase (TIGR00027 family)
MGSGGTMGGERHRFGPAPSGTSQSVAALRSQFQRPASAEGDAGAQVRLCAGMRPDRAMPLRPHLEARTRFVDQELVAAIGRGVAQVVILGAGYDDRALRFRSRGVRYFELDHPATQSDKRRRLEQRKADLAGATLVPADFRVDDVAATLAGSGHVAGRPSLFICEGLLVYLDQPTIVGLLGGLRSSAAEGSSLVASLAIHPDGIDSTLVLARANATRRGAASEPWLTILPAVRHLGLVAESGWVPVRSRDDATLGTGAVPDRSLCVVAHPGSRSPRSGPPGH